MNEILIAGDFADGERVKRLALAGGHRVKMVADCLSLVSNVLQNAEMFANYEPETVSGNSHQKRIQGGRHSWPEAKRRRGRK